MIVPILHGIYRWSRAPVTWIIFAMNLILFVAFVDNQERKQAEFSELMKNDQFVLSQGNAFAQFVKGHRDSFSPYLSKMAEAGLSGKKSQLELLGQMSIRYPQFLREALNYEYEGDAVELSYWKRQFKKMRLVHESDVSYMLGYGGYSEKPSVFSAISYQFVHGGFLHLVSNMWFLMIFGTLLEITVGSLPILVFYLIAGIVSAISFTFMSGDSAIPLVGASGSISGLMGLYILLFWKKPARCMFWLLPVKGYTGFVNLPVWAVMGIWLISDLAGYLGTLKEMGGVAHAAHLGGLAFGALAGLIFFRGKPTPERVFNNASGF